AGAFLTLTILSFDCARQFSCHILRDARIGARICERLNFIDEPLEVYPLLSNFIATNCKRLSRKPDIKDRNSFGRWMDFSRRVASHVASACRRCRRCPRRTEFVSRRDLRYLLRQARFGHNLANALDEGCGTERLLPQDHLNSGIQPRMILDRKVARSDDNDRDLVPDRMLLHLCYELKSIHLWHHQIENDDVRNAFPEPVEGETPILGLDQQPPLGFQPGANALSLHCVILDDQDPGWSGRRSIL